jgi:Arc/MetJ-type ribon-helix-helix transcriptional regulator
VSNLDIPRINWICGETMARPTGPKKRELCVNLTEPVLEWLDELIASGRYETKSLFIEHLIKDAMNRDKNGEPLSSQR